jgi:membrane-anchored protein YejM (alkaline phosphatase superfamily)
MGLSFWLYNDLVPVEPYQPVPLPLLNGSEVIQQPAALDKLVQLYVAEATQFIEQATRDDVPWFLYMAFNHVHEPNSCSAAFCGRSKQGPLGDAVEEMDGAVGQIMSAVKKAGADRNTLTIFTRCGAGPPPLTIVSLVSQ